MKKQMSHDRKILLILIAGFALVMTALTAMAEPPAFELQCRQKAKEVAAEAYRGCVTENRKVQIEQLKNDYQQKLKSLKEEYEGEIKKMSGARKSSEISANASTPAASAMVAAPVVKKSSRTSTRSSALRSLPSKSTADEMNIRLQPQAHDDSTMDIPEPIPVEGTSSDADSGV